jgi:hypothetical protein
VIERKKIPVPALLPEILKPSLRKLCVANRVLDRLMPKPILNCPRIVASVGQGVAAAVPQHVSMDLEFEASALTNAFDQAINSIRRERAAALSSEDCATVPRELASQDGHCPVAVPS